MKKYALVLIVILLIFLGSYKCPLYNIVGIPCPSCGMTRAWKLVLAGNIKSAFLMHPLFLLPPLLLLPKFQKKRWIVAIAVIFLVTYIIRMVVLFPGVAPMNYNVDSMIGEFLR